MIDKKEIIEIDDVIQKNEEFLFWRDVIRKPTDRWRRWGDVHQFEPNVLDNIPKSGFRIVGSTKRSSEWFGSGRNMFRVLHPEDFQFEITANNLLEILTTDDCIQGKLKGTYQLCWEGRQMALVNVEDEKYKEAIENLSGERFSSRKAKIGQKVKILMNGDQHEVYYLGKYHRLIPTNRKSFYQRGVNTTSYTVDWDKKRFFFAKDKKSTRCFEVTSTTLLRTYDEFMKVYPKKYGLFDKTYDFNLSIEQFPNQKKSYGNEYWGTPSVTNIRQKVVHTKWVTTPHYWGLMATVQGTKFRI